MKNKNLLIGTIIIILLAGGGFLFLSKKQVSAPSAMTSTTSEETSAEGNTSGSVFSSIKDALSKSLTLECSFSDSDSRMTKSYIKNGSIRVDIDGKTAEDTGHMIMMGKKYYFWNNKEGMMAEIPDEEEKTRTQQLSQRESMLELMEQNKSNCKPGVVSDSLFVPPTNVKFIDYTAMMKQAQQGNGKMDQKQAEEMMKQYATQETPADEGQ